MQSSFDSLIVGAGPAGCAAAYDLAHAGKQVLLLDKRTFPRHKACAGGLTRKTLAALRYSVEPIIEHLCHEIVLQQDCADPTHREIRMRARSAKKAQQTSATEIRHAVCAMTVREAFDNFCLQQTLLSGRSGGCVTLLKIDTLLGLRELPTHVEVDIATLEGPQTFRAPILLGADGSNSQVRTLYTHTRVDRGAALDWFTHGFALEATIPYSALPSKLPQGDAPHDLVFDFSPLKGGYGWLFPKGEHINIGIGVFAPDSPLTQLKQINRQRLSDYIHYKLGLILDTIDPAITHVTGQQLGMGGQGYIPHGRVLLLGDAAGLVDPLTGEGIHSAIFSGQAAAAAILSSEQDTAASYARRLAPLQQTLAFSHRIARAFYAQPERGFSLMRNPIMRNLAINSYTNGTRQGYFRTRLVKLVAGRAAAC